MAARLLDVDVLAGLAGEDGERRVPVVWRGDGDRVHVLVVEDLAEVLDALRRLLGLVLLLGDGVEGALKAPVVHVTQVGDLDLGQAEAGLDVVEAAAQPDHADHQPLAGGVGGAEQGRAGSQAGGERRSPAEEAAAVDRT